MARGSLAERLIYNRIRNISELRLDTGVSTCGRELGTEIMSTACPSYQQ